MKTVRPFYRSFFGVPGLCLLAACATTTLRMVQKDPGFNSAALHRVLVVSLSKDSALRQTVENEFVRQWKKRDVDAAASYAVLPPATPRDKAHVEPLARAQKCDAVLVIRLLGTSKINPQIPGQEFDADASTDDLKVTQYFQATVASPEYSSDYELAVVSANLYDTASDKRVWSGTTQTLIAGDIPKVVPDYAKVILDNLYKK